MLQRNSLNIAKISLPQIVMLISTSRIFTIMTHAQTFGEQANPLAKMFGSLLSIIFLTLAMIPVLLLYKKFNNVNVLDIVYNKSLICGHLLTIAFLYITVTTMITGVVGFEYFLSNAIYPQASAPVVITSLTIVCLICASFGLQGIARAGTFIFALFLLAFFFIVTTSVGSLNMLNIKPILDNPVQEIISYSLDFSSRGRGLIVLMLLFPTFNGSKTKATLSTIILTSFIACVMNFLVIGVLGEYGATQTFPYFALNSVIEIPILQRLDAIHMMTWAFMSFIHFSVFAYISLDLLRNILPKNVSNFSSLLLFAVIISVSLPMAFSGSIITNSGIETGLLLIFLLFLLPLILLKLPQKEVKVNV